ncbi:hypothetical protein COU79_00830 [Candidatus Peregrinibacteria bacterium CG10_big_fil_rev_8_21_14_0_10_54_7]|nr:MAG: hypothetical protein COU79_00830 [Candidatus Peregrinibacteria bacterium CG10_big_fil_rev_8_21_14_0_10_54_7]
MKRVLIVDDNERVRKVLHQILRRLPLEIQEARDGEQGLTLFFQSPFDLIITDYRMPKMDGLAMLKQCRQRFPELLCIVISGEHPEGMDQIEKVHFLQKPLNAGVLVRLVTHLLNMGKTQW